MAPLKAALFDLGGTLWEWYPHLTPEGIFANVAPSAIRLLRPEQAARVTPETLGVAVRRAYLDLEYKACNGDMSPMPVELCVQRGLAELGVAVDTATARGITAALHVSERHTTRLLPHAEETLWTLTESGLRLGIISNRMYGGDLLLDDLAYFGIDKFFDCIVTSCEVGQMKPHPALFRQALVKLGVAPSEAVMIGDDLLADIGGALACGLSAIWIRRPPERTNDPPYGVPAVRSLAELPAAIDKMR
jgi:HAD superfamily hydrolase (TIGR01509 family)